MMRQMFGWLWSIILLATIFPAEAQQSNKPRRIGVLSPRLGIEPRDETFRKGLRELGYIEGQNLIIEWRFAEEKPERLPTLAAELVALKVEVIVTYTTPAIRAAKQSTTTIPIVMANVGDPIAAGFVESLARPGGNITGLSNLSPTLGGKRLEILKEVSPKISRVAIFWNPEAHTPALKELVSVAPALRVQVQSVAVRTIDDIESAFETASKAKADGLITLPNSLLVDQRAKITSLALQKRLPAIFPNREIADAGGLMAYGPDSNENHRRAAVYVDKLLKGTKPQDLPVEQPMKFEFMVNLRTAKQLGLTIPPNVLMRADRVIR